jgi:uncharacterized protein with WD repeat
MAVQSRREVVGLCITFRVSSNKYSVVYLVADVTNHDSIKVYDTENFNIVLEITVPNIVELAISPKSNFLSTWERPGENTCFNCETM